MTAVTRVNIFITLFNQINNLWNYRTKKVFKFIHHYCSNHWVFPFAPFHILISKITTTSWGKNKKEIFMAISETLTWNENYAKKKRKSSSKRKREKIVSLYTCRANNFQFTPLTLKRSSAFSFQLSKTLAKIESGCWGKI